MTKRQVKLYTERVEELMAEKSRLHTQAQAFADIGLEETARPVSSSAATYEERIAPLLDVIGRDAEAAIHRISAASCFEKSGEASRAANLYRAALWAVHFPMRLVPMSNECSRPASRFFVRPSWTRTAESRRESREIDQSARG